MADPRISSANTGVVSASNITGTLPVSNGGTGVTAVTTSPTASSFAAWDANKNLSANNLLAGYRTTATAAGTTTLVVGDAELQYFTGVTTQTVVLPVTSTLALGHEFWITNNSTGLVTVQSSGANSIQVMNASTTAVFTCILITGTTAASWSVQYVSNSAITTPWVAYTPTFVGWGTVASINIFSRRIGDSLEIKGTFTSGTVTATIGTMTIGFNGTSANVAIDTAKIVASGTELCGTAAPGVAGAGSYTTLITQTDTGKIYFGIQAAGTAGTTAQAPNALIGNATLMSMLARVPISGWS